MHSATIPYIQTITQLITLKVAEIALTITLIIPAILVLVIMTKILKNGGSFGGRKANGDGLIV